MSDFKIDINALCGKIEERQGELFELLSSLVKINSESHKSHGNEETLARYLDKLSRELGLDTEVYSPLSLEGFKELPDYMEGRGLESRYNLSAVWRGEKDENALMLMAHTDTVEIGDPSNWERDALSGEILDGKIFGRGACDDKYALATIIFVIKILKELGFKPKKNLVFAAYCDEEYGGSHGALAAVLKDPCKMIVNMDGRENQIWHCGSGGGEFKYVYHTAAPADSAKTAATALPIVLDVIEGFAERRRAELRENRFYRDTIIPDTALRYMGIRAGNAGMDLGVGEVHFVYYTDKTKEEIYAELSELEAVLRERLLPLGLIGDGFKPATRFFHYVHSEPDTEEIRTMVEASKEAIGVEPMVCGSCLSDLSVISKYGSTHAFAYGCGRDFSKKGGAHQPNEFMECESLVRYAKVIAACVVRVLG